MKKTTKVQRWLIKNYRFVTGAVIALTAIGLTVAACKGEDSASIEPDNGWMDILKVPFNDSKVTVRQITNLADYYSKLVDWINDHDGTLTTELLANFDYIYSTDFPDKMDSIELALV